MANLTGKVALISGASRGIGAATAEYLAACGASIAITYYHNKEKADDIVENIIQSGGKAIAICADAGDIHQASSVIKQVIKEYGELDILVNNAGRAKVIAFADYDWETLDNLIDVNIRGVFALSQAAAKQMNNEGRIINIGSVSAQRAGRTGMTGYALTKSAILGLTKAMARDLAEQKITVNVINPGHINTDMNPITGGSASQRIESIPAARYGETMDIAQAVAFLASDEASYITGTSITIDGGLTC